MDNKLSELSKPASWSDERGNLCTNTIKERGMDSKYRQDYEKYSTPLYSQEYVSALLAEMDRLKRLVELIGENWENDISDLLDARQLIAELEQKEHHSERQKVIDGLAGAGEAWSDIEEYMAKWDEEHRKAIGENSVRYQCREIGEGGWMDCDKDRYDYCQRRPEMDTRTVSSPLAGLEAKDKRIVALERINKAQDDHINQQQDRIDSLEKTNAGLGRRLGDAEKRLATPVRLPETYSPEPWMGPDPSGTWLEKEDVKDSIRAAGFTVGDE